VTQQNQITGVSTEFGPAIGEVLGPASIFFRNVANLLPDYTLPQQTNSLRSPPW